jgi:thiamine biosynthesis lipoprotein
LPVASQNEKSLLHIHGQTMGTTFQVKVADAAGASNATEILQRAVDDTLAEINRQMSTFQSASEISRFNNSRSSEPMRVSRGLVDILRLALQVNRESNGAFDVTVNPLVELWGFGKKNAPVTIPPQAQIDSCLNCIGSKFVTILNDSIIAKSNPCIELDFGGIAQGYGVDAVAELVHRKGYRNFLVEIGGELALRGLNLGRKWQIGIDRPSLGALPGQNLEAVLELSELAVSTSGDYRDFFMINDTVYSHTINPVTGRPVNNGLASVTIIAPNCMLADALCTAVMVIGPEQGLRWIESMPGVEVFMILRDGDKFTDKMTPGFRKYLR